VENHVLARSKEDLLRLQKELKRMANERDGLKKKIIESVKRERKRSRFDDEEDEEDSSSSFFVLS
jgi:hypothetical protein